PSNPTDASPSEASGRSFHNSTSRRRDLRGILTTHEARNVGNVGPREFGATVPDIGPKRPKSLRRTHRAPSSVNSAQCHTAQGLTQ
ncbi:hypothetical protein PIB30_068015, partial [Stylosanthes scabra]|nr:hypothetical protein [Stylosanthes scabra]